MRVLLTGGYGCIGSWIVRNLLDRGDQVWVYDLKEDPRRLRLILDPAGADESEKAEDQPAAPARESASKTNLKRTKADGEGKLTVSFDNPLTGRADNLMEGLYLRTEKGGAVSGRAKFVRGEFVEKIK